MIVTDCRIPDPVRKVLEKYGEVYLLHPQEKVYPAIASHPDIFIADLNGHYILSPDLLTEDLEVLTQAMEKAGKSWEMGSQNLASSYPHTIAYHVSCSDKVAVGNFRYTDPLIRKRIAERNMEEIAVRQGYVRCNLLWIGNEFICSDKGIEARLRAKGWKGVYVSPQNILLPPFKNGFVGGCLGKTSCQLFSTGHPDLLSGEERKGIEEICERNRMEWIALGKEWTDLGGLFFI